MTHCDPHPPERDLRQALWRGFRQKCPNCGSGDILYKYLKVNDSCSECGQGFSTARADDGPAYFTILIVGHLAGFALHLMWVLWKPDPLVMALVITSGAVGLALWALPRIKGAFIALQWAKRLYGL